MWWVVVEIKNLKRHSTAKNPNITVQLECNGTGTKNRMSGKIQIPASVLFTIYLRGFMTVILCLLCSLCHLYLPFFLSRPTRRDAAMRHHIHGCQVETYFATGSMSKIKKNKLNVYNVATRLRSINQGKISH